MVASAALRKRRPAVGNNPNAKQPRWFHLNAALRRNRSIPQSLPRKIPPSERSMASGCLGSGLSARLLQDDRAQFAGSRDALRKIEAQRRVAGAQIETFGIEAAQAPGRVARPRSSVA